MAAFLSGVLASVVATLGDSPMPSTPSTADAAPESPKTAPASSGTQR